MKITNSYQIQKKITLFRKMNVTLKRIVQLFKLIFRFQIDQLSGSEVNLAAKIVSFESNNSLLIDEWKIHLDKTSSLLKLFRLELAHQKVLERCEVALKHQYNLLGQHYNSSISKDNYVLWHYDPTSEYQWEMNTWYRKSRKNLPNGVDIKLPWELSRCQHFILLGEAYHITRDERYTTEFCKQILDWIGKNPVRRGPNWTPTMEVGIRVANWMIALLYFENSPKLDKKFLATLLFSTKQHGHHIRANLENNSFITSNHYLGNISGLYVLSVLCPVLNESIKWKNFARKELEKEICRQTLGDGWNFESSSTYHRLATELFLYPFLIAEFLNEPFSDRYKNQLKKMIRVLGESLKPNGAIPQIGDNDNGRFLIFKQDREPENLNIDYLLETTNRIPSIHTEFDCIKSIVYKDAGRYLFKSSRMYFMITSGPKGQAGRGGHAHNDVMSFELNVDKKDIIVDPGTYCYTANPNKRNCFRSVRNHSTLYWEKQEPCSLDCGLFLLPEEGILTIEKCDIKTNEDFFSAKYEYKNRSHRREIHLNKSAEEIRIRDSCSHNNALLSFVCAPNNTVATGNDGFYVENVHFSFDNAESIMIGESNYSPSYGKLQPNKIIKVKISGKSSLCIIKPIT